MIEFTKDELFFIEQEFDLKAAVLHKNLWDTAEKFMIIGAVNNKDYNAEIRALLMMSIQEIHRCIDITKSIRDKLEKERIGSNP